MYRYTIQYMYKYKWNGLCEYKNILFEKGFIVLISIYKKKKIN